MVKKQQQKKSDYVAIVLCSQPSPWNIDHYLIKLIQKPLSNNVHLAKTEALIISSLQGGKWLKEAFKYCVGCVLQLAQTELAQW